MCIALIGGMKRLEAHYFEDAARIGIDLRVFNESQTNIGRKIRHVDAIVIFTNKVSHRLRVEALKVAKANGIPVVMEHSCGVCTFRECISCFGCKKLAGYSKGGNQNG